MDFILFYSKDFSLLVGWLVLGDDSNLKMIEARSGDAIGEHLQRFDDRVDLFFLVSYRTWHSSLKLTSS
jgi:hypothetical protein